MNLSTRLNLLILTASHSVNSVYNRYLTPVLPLILADFHLPYWKLALVVSAYSAGNFIFQFPISFLADYTGRRRTVVVISLLVNSIPVVFIGFADTYMFLLTLVFISGVGSSAYHPAAISMVAQQAPSQRGFALGLFKAGGDFGSVFTPAIVGWLAVALSWRAAAQWCVLPGVIWAVLIGLRFKDTPSASCSRGPMGQAALSTILALLRNRAILFLAVLSSCRVMCLRGIMTFVPLLLAQEFGFNTGWVGWVVTTYFIFGTISSVVQGRFSDRFNHTAFIMGMLFVSAAVLALVPLADSLWVFFPILFVLAVNLGPSQAPILAVTTEITGNKNHSSAVGLLYTVNEFAGMLSPVVGGIIAGVAGLQKSFLFYSGVALLGTAASVMVHRVLERQRMETVGVTLQPGVGTR